MTYRFLPKAEIDLNHAVDYYERCEAGLGTDFLIETHNTIDRILEYPESWTEISSNCRRCLTNRFPYEIIYSVEGDVILVLAVANQHRHPDFWKNR
jgi:plasmid stabilization system protein ParE